MILPPINDDPDHGSDPEVWDLVVVGAGVAGTALASRQAREGRRVLLLERDFAQPDRMVGELLQPGGYLMLKALGMEACVEGIDSQRVSGYVLYRDGRYAVTDYPLQDQPDDVAGRSFHHGRFVQRLRHAAAATPGVTCRQGIVRSLVGVDGEEWTGAGPVGGVAYRRADGSVCVARAHLTAVCNGKESQFRRLLAADPRVVAPSHYAALVLRGADLLPFPGRGYLVFSRPSHILFYPISSGEVRCLVDFPGPRLPRDLAAHLRDVVAAEVPPELREAFLLAAKAGPIRTMQTKQVSARPLRHPGVVMIGDSCNVRNPITGGGMTVALSDVAALSAALARLPPAGLADVSATERAIAGFYARRGRHASAINSVANTLWRIMAVGASPARDELAGATFAYLSQGTPAAAVPLAIVGGLCRAPAAGVAAFAAIVALGAQRALAARPLSLGGLRCAAALVVDAVRCLLPVVWAEGVLNMLVTSVAPPVVPALAPRAGAA